VMLGVLFTLFGNLFVLADDRLGERSARPV